MKTFGHDVFLVLYNVSKVSFFIFLFFQFSIAQKKEPTSSVDSNMVSSTQEAPLPKIEIPEFFITGHEDIFLSPSTKTLIEEEKIYSPENISLKKQSKTVSTELSLKKDFSSKFYNPLNGKVLVGFGAYTTPFIAAWFTKIFEQVSLLADANYSSSKGHVVNAGWEKGGVNIEGGYNFFSDGKLKAGLSFDAETYYLYGSPLLYHQQQILNNFSVWTGMDFSYNKIFYSGKIFYRNFTFSAKEKMYENEFGILAKASTQISKYTVNGSLEYFLSSLSMNQLQSQFSPQWIALKAGGNKNFTSSLQLSAQLQQFFYRGNTTEELTSKFLPQVGFHYTIDNSFNIFGGFFPTVQQTTLYQLTHRNKYIYNTQQLIPTETPISFQVGSEKNFNQNLKASITAQYNLIHQYPFFVDDTMKVWNVFYFPTVQQWKGELQSSYEFTDKNSVTVSLNVNSTKENDSLKTVPYTPQYTVGALYQHQFAFPLRAEISSKYISERWIDKENTKTLGGYFLLGAKGDYEYVPNFHIIIEIQNFLNQQYYYWDNYKERTFFVSLGISYVW